MKVTIRECVELIYEAFCSMIYDFSSQFSINDIVLTTDLVERVKDYGIDEDASGGRGATLTLDTGIKVIVETEQNPVDFAETVFHELIHVRDILWFKNNYNVIHFLEHPLYNTLQVYTEYNAHKLGTLLAIEFIRIGTGIELEKDIFLSIEDFRQKLVKTKTENNQYSMRDLYIFMAQASLLDEQLECEDYLKAVFDVMPNYRCSKLLYEIYLQCQSFPPKLEELDSLVKKLCSCS